MKKATVILSMVLILILSFGTVTAFASGVEFEEIPYTYDTQEKVNSILEQILLKGENPNNIIKIPEISY